MVDIETVYCQRFVQKAQGKEQCRNLYSIGKKVYQDDGKIFSEGFALDREALKVLRANIMAILID